MNLRFEYLYRDAGNYKNWGDLVFSNKNNRDSDYLEKQARKLLIDGEFFVAEKAAVPDLKFQTHINTLDHDWHEFHALTPTIEDTNDPYARDITEFIESLRYAASL